jgi:hypothetical protein
MIDAPSLARVWRNGANGWQDEAHRGGIHGLNFQIFREGFRRPLLNAHQAFEREFTASAVTGVPSSNCIFCAVKGPGFPSSETFQLSTDRLRRPLSLSRPGFVFDQPLIGRVGDRPVVIINSDGRVERLRIGGFTDDQHIFGHGSISRGDSRCQRNGQQQRAKPVKEVRLIFME